MNDFQEALAGLQTSAGKYTNGACEFTLADIEFKREEPKPGDTSDWKRHLELFDYHGIELRDMTAVPDIETYMKLHAAGRLVLITARLKESGDLVGYSIYIVIREIHFQQVIAMDDVIFVLPHFRKIGIGTRLRQAALEECRKAGCKLLLARFKVNHMHEQTMQRLGFRPFEVTYCKDI